MNRFLIFLKNPLYTESFIKIEWSHFFILLGAFYLLEMPLGILVKLICNILGLEIKQMLLPYPKKVLYGLLLAPFFEELVLRLYLVFNKKNILILLISFFGFTIYFFLKGSDLKFYLFTGLFLFVLLTLINYLNFRLFFISCFKYIFYISAILFGLLHIFNFNGITTSNFILTPIIILPQLIMGLLFGYVRVTYGFVYSVAFHSFVNIPILFSL